VKGLTSFISNGQNALALGLVGAFVLVALLAPWLAPLDADGVNGHSRVISGLTQPNVPRPPAAGIPLGTLPGSFDVVYGLVWGSRSAIRVGLTVALSTAILGIALGAISGAVGGTMREIMMRGTDAFLAFPVIAGVVMFHFILGGASTQWLARMITNLLGTFQLTPLLLALISLSWMPYARLVDATITQIKEAYYVQAARALGAGRARIIVRHLIPNAVSPAFVFVARDVGASVILVAAFTFIGLGAESEWGQMLVFGRDWVIGPGGNPLTYWWTYVPATAALLLFGVGWNLLGDGLQGEILLNPSRRRGRSWLDWLNGMLRSHWAPVFAALGLGVVIGLTYGWAIRPAPPSGIRPSQLRAPYREDYLRAAIGSFAANHDPGKALARFQALGNFAELTLNSVRTRPGNVSSAAVRDFISVIDPFRRQTSTIGSSVASDGNLLAGLCIAGLAAIVCLAGIVAMARRSLRPSRRGRDGDPHLGLARHRRRGDTE
jgi:peptide/nickel transport system permease protein